MNPIAQTILSVLLGLTGIITSIYIGESMSDHRKAKLDKDNPKRLELEQYKQGVKDSTVDLNA